MIQINSRVKINDTYSGGAHDVVGKTAKVTKIDGDVYQLDLVVKREPEYYTGHFFDYNVIVHSSEVDEEPYEFNDMKGVPVHIGDTVVYATSNGNLLTGDVVDFKNWTTVRWGNDRKELKFLLEYDIEERQTDGGDRAVSWTEKKKVWLGSSRSTLVVKKAVDIEASG